MLDKDMTVVRSFLVGCLMVLGGEHANAEWVSPWEQGEDISAFYDSYCAASDLSQHYFPALEANQREVLRKLITEVIWVDVSDYILDLEGSSTALVLKRLKKVDGRLIEVRAAASQGSMRARFVYAHNRNLKQRDTVIERFDALGRSDTALAGAMLTYLECGLIQNAKSLNPVVTGRIEQIKAIRLEVLPPQESLEGQGHSDHSYSFESGCRCGSGDFCYGPRGGRYCITSGGKKDYR